MRRRMPVILLPAECAARLDRRVNISDLRAMLAQREWRWMATRLVGWGVNRAGADRPGLVETVEMTGRL